ncbi:MAG: DUF1318 domain-containing protein [Rhodospirillales bacterium]|nr:DUF1318 domain-containing protein [Rhodospirillales bacterium]MDP7214592.1 DUF1318 domain-containing protein [Rhodospirillales bacterium]HIJ46235.1 YdbL family protein [Rhodospirillaceae bacterium]HIJ93295.1 YdbL family protein [Rhodospirillaceae bacterium]
MKRNSRWARGRRRFLSLIPAFAAAAAMVLFTAAADAQSLGDLRASGAAGEGYDGYARVRVAGGDVSSVVDAVNAKRRSIYQQRASEQGTTAAQVGRVYAREIFAKVPAGTWLMMESGQWTRK